MRFMILTLSGIFLFGCASQPQVDYEGCAPRTLFWALGPKPGQAYLDVCHVELDMTEANQYFDYVPIQGFNQDTRQPMDNNRDGISGNGRLLNNGQLHWGGSGCSQYARRIVQQSCDRLGNAVRTGGCEWIAVQLTPKRGIEQAYVSFTPVSRVRQPDGSEADNFSRTFTTGFSNCP